MCLLPTLNKTVAKILVVVWIETFEALLYLCHLMLAVKVMRNLQPVAPFTGANGFLQLSMADDSSCDVIGISHWMCEHQQFVCIVCVCFSETCSSSGPSHPA